MLTVDERPAVLLKTWARDPFDSFLAVNQEALNVSFGILA
jgi:hypothetical protein